VKGLRIGRRRAREQAASPLELALRPALVDERWQVPDRFNFTRDVVEALAGNPKRSAITVLGRDGVIEPRTFLDVAEAAGRRAATLTEHGVHPKDRVIVMAETSMHWLELVLGIWKAGAVAVPVLPSIATPTLEALHASTSASLVVAEPACNATLEAMSFTPDVLYVEEGGRGRASDTLKAAPTHDTSSRDLALVFGSPGTAGAPKEIGHTHAAVFASRVQAEQWLDAGRGDVVWCTAEADSPLAIWFTLAGPWSRGAETVIHQGQFDMQERLEHLYRIGPTILCQSAAEYRALAGHGKLERFRPPRLRRLVSTGDVLEPEVLEIFEARWGLTIHDGYGQAESNIVAGDARDGARKAGAMGRALTGYEIAIVDDQGNELPKGVEGDLAIRGHPPTLFAGYWDAPDETKRAFRGDLYLTGDVAVADDEGFLTYVARAEDVITSSGRTFGPHVVEHVLRSHDAIVASAVVGIRDLQRGGHFVRAFVVLVPGIEGTEQLQAEVRQFLGQVLPDQQVPREIVFVDELPTVRGRVSRAASPTAAGR
jgi:acyl-coenzyme A synthetase/AMP-(fatty) acid ligase